MADPGTLTFYVHHEPPEPLSELSKAVLGDWRTLAIAIAFDLEMAWTCPPAIDPPGRSVLFEIPIVIRKSRASALFRRVSELFRARCPEAPQAVASLHTDPVRGEAWLSGRVSLQLGGATPCGG